MEQLHGLTTEQMLDWERDGYLVLENLLSEDEVKKYNESMDSVFAEWRAQGKPTFGNLTNIEQVTSIIEWDDAFVDMMEHPKTMQIMRDLLGDSFTLIDNDGLIKPANSVSHTQRWHRDADTVFVSGGKKHPFLVKIFYYLSDVPYDGGCLALLPGSVHLRNDQIPVSDSLEDLPGHVRMNVKAGTAVIFNSSTYHVALNNYSNVARRNLYFTYAPTFIRPFKGYEASDKLRAKATTKLRKMLYGEHPWVSGNYAFQDDDTAE